MTDLSFVHIVDDCSRSVRFAVVVSHMYSAIADFWRLLMNVTEESESKVKVKMSE